MEIKKSPKADLQQYKSIFFLLGLCITLGLCYVVFNWKTTYELDTEITQATGPIVEQEVIPMTQQQEQKPELPPPPQAPKVVTKINLVQRDVDLNDDIDPFNTELNEDQGVDIYEWTDGGDDEEEVAEEEIFFIVEEMPSFQGGDLNTFRTFVQKRCRFPEAAAEAGIQGKVQLTFVVEKDGSVSGVKVLRGVDPLLDNEAIRVVKGSPKWSPGKQRGKPARVRYTIPVVFYLQS